MTKSGSNLFRRGGLAPEAAYAPAQSDRDHIDVIANAVRYDRPRLPGPVHKLSHAWQDPTGRAYGTVCGLALYAATGAILTSWDVTCPECLPEPAGTP